MMNTLCHMKADLQWVQLLIDSLGKRQKRPIGCPWFYRVFPWADPCKALPKLRKSVQMQLVAHTAFWQLPAGRQILSWSPLPVKNIKSNNIQVCMCIFSAPGHCLLWQCPVPEQAHHAEGMWIGKLLGEKWLGCSPHSKTSHPRWALGTREVREKRRNWA